MKKGLLLIMMSMCFIACSVDNEEPVLQEDNFASLDAQHVNVDRSDACSPTISIDLCSDEIESPNVRGFRAYFEAQIQLHTDLPLDGYFDPSPAELVEQYEEAGGYGTFASVYHVETEECGSVTSEVTVTVNNCSGTPCAEDIFVEVCADEIQDPEVNEFETYFRAQVQLHTDLPLDGTFSPSIEDVYSEYTQSAGIGTFTTNYSVDTEACGEVTIEVAAQVSNCSQEPCAEDIYLEECAEEIQNPQLSEFDNYFRAQVQLHSDLPLDGTFDPTMEELYNEYNQSAGLGTYVTNYTVDTEACGEVSIEITADLKDCREYDPGANELYVEVCANEVVNPTVGDFDTFFRAQIQVATDLPTDGTFSPSMEELHDDYYENEGLGTYTTNYTVDTEDGEVTVEITVELTDCVE